MYQLTENTLLPSQKAVLTFSSNKKQLMSIICSSIISDEKFHAQHTTRNKLLVITGSHLLGDPWATSREDAILKSTWELILTELVPEEVELRPGDWAEIYFSAQSAMRSNRVTLSPSYTK